MIFLLYGVHSVVAMSRHRLRDIDPQENPEEWLDVDNRDDLYNYDSCNNNMLDLDKDFDWASLSLNVLGKKSMKKNKKSTDKNQGKRKRSKKSKLLSPLQHQQTQQQQQQPQKQQLKRKLKISKHN